MNPEFWRGKKVFLTGHTGFKGSWLSLWLQALGAEVTGYARASSTTPSLFDEAGVERGMQSYIGDVCDLKLLADVMQLSEPEIVIHMAAQPLVSYAYANPVETYATNVMGTVHLLEAVRKIHTVRAVLNVTTDKCYENNEWDWGYRECDPMGGYDPYSSSKGAAELVTSAYRSSFFSMHDYHQHGVAIATARAGNVIGGGDWTDDRLVPNILHSFLQQITLNLRNPTAIRPWQFVLEPLRGYLTLLECLYSQGMTYAEGWNFGPNDSDVQEVQWIVEKMADIWGGNPSWTADEKDHPHEANFLKLDISKARNRLHWQPVLCLEDTLKWIVDWSKKRQEGHDLRQLSLAQIQQYQNLFTGQ